MKSVELNVFHREGNKKQLECIYHGPAFLDKSGILIYQDDQSVTKVLWDPSRKQMMILRQSEMRTLLVLNQSGSGTITVTTDFGEMQLKNETRLIQISDEKWIADYDVINGNEKMNNRFIWKMKEMEHEQS